MQTEIAALRRIVLWAYVLDWTLYLKAVVNMALLGHETDDGNGKLYLLHSARNDSSHCKRCETRGVSDVSAHLQPLKLGIKCYRPAHLAYCAAAFVWALSPPPSDFCHSDEKMLWLPSRFHRFLHRSLPTSGDVVLEMRVAVGSPSHLHALEVRYRFEKFNPARGSVSLQWYDSLHWYLFLLPNETPDKPSRAQALSTENKDQMT